MAKTILDNTIIPSKYERILRVRPRPKLPLTSVAIIFFLFEHLV